MKIMLGVLLVILSALLMGAAYANQSSNVIDDKNYVVRVIFAETVPSVSPDCNYERLLVASVIQGRIGHPGFGKLKSMVQVVKQKGAFSCVNDSKNQMWKKGANPDTLKGNEKEAYEQCLKLAAGDFEAILGPSGEKLVYYHDRSLKAAPKGWYSKYYEPVLEIETEHFKFYSVRARKV